MITSPEKEGKEGEKKKRRGAGLERVRNTLIHPFTFHRLPIKAFPAVEERQREKAAARGGSICVFPLCATSRAATITPISPPPPPGGTGCVWEREVRDLLRLTHTHTTLTSPTERPSERADADAHSRERKTSDTHVSVWTFVWTFERRRDNCSERFRVAVELASCGQVLWIELESSLTFNNRVTVHGTGTDDFLFLF